MVSSKNGDSVLIADLEGNQQGHSLNRVVSSVHIVSHEEVVSVGWLSSDVEQLTKIMELSVDVSTDSHGGLHVLHVRLIDQDLLCLSHKQHCQSFVLSNQK